MAGAVVSIHRERKEREMDGIRWSFVPIQYEQEESGKEVHRVYEGGYQEMD